MNNLPLKNKKFHQTKFLFLTIFLTFILTVPALTQNLNVDNSFTAGVSDAPPNVYISTTLPDGKILVGGLFHLTNGVQKPFLARLNSDGTLDASFNPGGSGPNGSVYEIIVFADGKILIGGTFSTYNGTAKGGLARLNADGSLDATFNPGGAGTVGTVQTIALQTDGKILVSGSISSYNGIARFSVVRVNADGTLDTTFASPFTTSQFVEEVDVQADGRILIGGDFTIGSYSDVARLNADGSLDSTFASGGTDGAVYALTLLPDGKILIGGDFTFYRNSFRPKIARLNPDGTLDASFNPGNLDGASVEYFAIQTDGKILAAGRFVDFFNQQFSIVRFNPNGSLDNSFLPAASDDTGYSVKLQADGKIMLTGFFTQIGNENRRGIARLNSNGSVDNSFNASFSNLGLIDAIAQQPDGKIIVGGTFQRANGTASFNIARFNLDGTLDTTFNTGTGSGANISNFSNLIYDIAVQPDGKILVGGTFSSFNGVFRPAIVRLNADGSVDTSFNATSFDPIQLPFVFDIFIQSDGRILIGGFFIDSFQQQFRGLYRLNTNGSVDTTFNSGSRGASSAVYQIVRQPDGKLIIGGSFTTYNGVSRVRVARLNADGTLDASFNPGAGANGTVIDIALQNDGKIIIGGSFTTYNGISRNRLARLNSDGSLDTTFNVGTGASSTINTIELLSDGKILIGGFFINYNGTTANRLARINADGSLDTTFTSGIAGNPIHNVREIFTQADGRILIGGVFDSYNGIARNSLVRLTTANLQPTRFDFDGDGRADISVFRPSNGTWYLLNSASGFAAAQFGDVSDKIVPADYDGDGKTDLAVYRAGIWYLQRSSLGFAGISFGDGNDIPQPADFDGDGKSELAVFRPSNGTWYVLNLANNQFNAVQFGQSGDKPVVGDYDGDGRADYAVYRGGTWYLQRSTAGFIGVAFGASEDKPVPMDYDGDGKTDIAVFRPSNGVWYLLQSTAGFAGIQFGFGTDLPVPADYDGDGRADIAVYRGGTWYLQRSTAGFTSVAFGANTDKPIPSAFIQ